MQEQFVKEVAVFCGFDIKARETCGELLRRDDIKKFFKDVLRVDDFTYTKMQDYTLKVNAHKHKGEKHIQVVSVNGNTVIVNVGSVEHPMAEEHNIQWVYLQTDRGGQRKCLEVGKAPVVTFALADEKPIAVYAYCNLHGLWMTEV